MKAPIRRLSGAYVPVVELVVVDAGTGAVVPLRQGSGLPTGYMTQHPFSAYRVDRHGGLISPKEPIRGTPGNTQTFGRLRRKGKQ